MPRLRFRINGIIESETNKVIILEDLDENKIVYLKKGEKYKKLKVKYILTNTVLLLNEGVEENYEINK